MGEPEALMQRDGGRIGRDNQRIGAVDIGPGQRLKQRFVERLAEAFSL